MSAQPLSGAALRSRTVSNRLAADVLDAAVAAGVGPDLFAQRTGISARDLTDVDGRIDGVRHARFVEFMCSLSPSIEWLVERRCALFPHFPALGNLCFNARTLRDAIDAFMRFRPIVGEFDFLFFRETADWVQIEYVAEFMPQHCLQALANFQVLATLIRAYDMTGTTLFHVSLTGRAPRNARLLADYFGAPIQFEASANCMRFAASLLDRPFSHYNAPLAPHLLQQAQQKLQQSQRGYRFSASVEQLITALVTDPDNDMPGTASLLARVCERLETSRWTLHRRLRIEGLNFGDLEARVKLDQACRLLGETQRSLSEISEMLGFSSQSAFTRFFRSRHQMAPQAFRQHQQQWNAVSSCESARA
ncbi:AraC family transcriptional regulator [Paraburkholderia sp. Ac-20340]|uniref:AraC family transcriptional regulator n=1 Tax=Paraburkholderia sp. Ac-20340 TaxID=2703888 RepID=UPI0019813843|nr:AraC family transcriptional regulator [Paraburkholderia sp. Ac-20340]MBN3853525.1 AraC family transcriptional regulator [Paraburkholderia sp. Ac-20340]